MQPALAAAALLVGGYVGFSYAAAVRLLRPPRLVGDWHPGVLGLSYEEFEARARDGAVLRGWFIDRGAEETVLVIHGYTRSRWDDKYACPAAYMLARMGFNVAVYDQRGHGESGGGMTYLGAREAEDAERVIEELRARWPGRARRIGVLGFSLGGAVAVMLAAGGGVDAAVADSPYMDILESARGWIRRYPAPARLLLEASFPLVVRLAALKLGVDPGRLVLYPYARRLRAPLLLVAGERDDLVPLESIRRFYEEARRGGAVVDLWVTGSGHVESLRDSPVAYRERVGGWLERWLRGGA